MEGKSSKDNSTPRLCIAFLIRWNISGRGVRWPLLIFRI